MARENPCLRGAERPFHIDAWVVLPDHLHAVWTLPEGDADFSTRWRLIKTRLLRGLPNGPRRARDMARGERAIWQRRFWEHHVCSAEDRAALIRYCHINPVKDRLVETPEAGPYPSVHRERRDGRRVRDVSHPPSGDVVST